MDIKDWTMPLRTVIPGLSTLFQWGNGGVVANGFSATYLGLIKIDSGSLGIYQRIGNLSYYIGGVTNKYGYFKGINTQYGINGSISYQFTPDFSLTAFGAYYFGRPSMMCNGLPMPPSMIGYYGLSRFGGYFDYRISERFGVKIGGQAVQLFGLNRIEFEPIATPYIKAGTGKRKFRIELSVGQILYNSLKIGMTAREFEAYFRHNSDEEPTLLIVLTPPLLIIYDIHCVCHYLRSLK